jgi:glycosyltransferase involved in cell wall biosynthesis
MIQFTKKLARLYMYKVLGFAFYGQKAASNRYRLGQYRPGLLAIGISLEINSLFGDQYLVSRFEKKSIAFNQLIKDFLIRCYLLLCQKKFDAVILQYELVPFFPAWFEKLIIRKPYIFDFDDAIYLKYRRNAFTSSFPYLRNKFDLLISGAIAVTAGNEALTSYARKLNKNTFYLPTVVDTKRFFPIPKDIDSGVFKIGWVGSPSTTKYLKNIIRPLSILGLEGEVHFYVIGGKSPKIENIKLIELSWTEENEVEQINNFDVGIMPLTNDEWSRGKCAFKLIQYMACGIPVIASSVGANIDLVTPDCGYLVNTESEWLVAFRRLRDNPTLRERFGNASRSRIIEKYSLENNLTQISAAIKKSSLRL